MVVAAEHSDRTKRKGIGAPPPHPLIDQESFTELRTDGWRVLDCRFDLEQPQWGQRAYRQGHIPGAQYVHLERDLSAQPSGENGRHPLPPIRELEALFSRLGIGSATHVLRYDSSGGPFAARLWWTLRYLGHDRVQVLDGGLPAWKRQELPLESGVETVDRTGFEAKPRPELLTTVDQVEAALGQPEAVLIDARDPERFRGEREPYDPVAGRIPGALNHHWKQNLGARGHFLPPAQLRQALRASLDDAGPRMISYCGSGVTAAHNALAMVAAGLAEPELYVGSWSEWCADRSRPLERGD